MFARFLQGLLLGYGASVPIGPINILIASYAIKDYKKALSLGLGAMSADITYLLLLTFGLLHILENEIIKKSVAIFGFCFLLYMAYTMIKNAKRHLALKEVSGESSKILYSKGLFLTLLNPYTIGFWLSVASIATSQNFTQIFILLFGLFCAIFSWITLFPYMIWKNKHFISDEISKYISIIAGFILIFFAFFLLFNIFAS